MSAYRARDEGILDPLLQNNAQIDVDRPVASLWSKPMPNCP